MDSRYNHGEGFSISRETEFQFVGSWIPPTPEKSVPRQSNLIPIRRDESHLGGMNWQELTAFPNGFPEKMFNNNTLADHFWQIDEGRQGQFSFQNMNLEKGTVGPIVEEGRQSEYSFLQDMLEACAMSNHIGSSANSMAMRNISSFTPQNGVFRENMSTAGVPIIPVLQPQVNNYQESSSRGPYATHRTHYSSSNQLRSQHCSPQMFPYYADGFPLPSHAGYNLNSPPRTIGDATFNSLQFPPVTPDKTRIWENNSGSTVNPLAEKWSSKERDKQHDLVITAEHEVTGSNSGELLHHTGDSSSAVIASPSDEPKESNVGIFQGIDLNKTPQIKPPKRKKHRPKVIVEGKPKRTPKSTPKASDSMEMPTVKRKYIRKMALNKSATEHTASAEQTLSVTGNTEVVDIPSSKKANGKRKYVRKKQEPETQHECSSGGVNLNMGNTDPASCDTDPRTPTGKRKIEHKGFEESNQHSNPGTAKSCRRALKFDLPNSRDQKHITYIQQQEMADKEKVALNLNTCPEATETSNVANSKMPGTKSVPQISLHNRLQEQSRQLGAASNHRPSMYQRTRDYVTLSERQQAEAQRDPTKIQMENLNVNAMYKNTGTPQHIHEQIVFPEKTSYEEVFQNLKSQNNAQSTNFSFGGNKYKRGLCPSEQRNPFVADLVGPSLLNQNVFLTDCHHQKCSNISQNQIGSEMQRSTSTMATHTTAMKDPIQGTIRVSDVNSSGFPSKQSYGRWESHSRINNINESIQKFSADWNIHLLTGHNVPKMADGSSRVTEVLNGNKLPQVSLHTGSISTGQVQPKACSTDVSRNQQIMEHPRCNLGPSQKGIMQQEENPVKDRKPVKRRARPPKQRFSTVEDITYQMGSLNLNGQEHRALVLYKSGGDIVPYAGFEFLKKRKPRPKVDLDPETERVWKLLMWNEGSEGIEGTGEETDKRWEEERKIFRGRVDSFIARMHLVQGDRRFSKWKGSVVDSVIGVFLTQNVSDHLSSSAFMHLAARFPLKPGKNTSSRNEMSILVEEPVACILNPDTSIKWHEISLSNIAEHERVGRTSSKERMSLSKTTEHQRGNSISWMERTSNREMHCQSPEEEVLSSQESFGSSVIQVNGMGSGSNSEADDPVTGCEPNSKLRSYSLNLQEFYNHIGENSIFKRGPSNRHQPAKDGEEEQQRQKLEMLHGMKGSSTSNMQISYINSLMQPPSVPSYNQWLHTDAQFERQVERFQSFAEESISSWPSATARFAIEKDASGPGKRIQPWEETSCKTPVQKFGPLINQESPVLAPHAIVSKHSVCINGDLQSYKKTHERNEIFQRENTVIAEPTNLVESLFRSQNACSQHISNIPKLIGEVFHAENSIALADKQTNSGHKSTESNSKQKGLSIDKGNTQLNANASKTRKRKAESDKKNAVDWESLRLQVEPNGKKKERSKETMDSLDYEALRCSSVKEISETIKERGMNNMLAERIKEFLNRLVTEHGSIDLEWLRDAPPDEAKKYLLSIRGLGLKSVECVRLLTLHHLAFPVDTNVGRIAVRLGWVPLRPLPESLQLHLLELYPILESIQKYLWPRLCKLDQRTLYELHYQLITFGKVFCTKSKPNCNACPMRAECRHFASAFASARLALPGPEEKSIMPKTVPFAAEKNSGIVINPMPLPSLEDNIIPRAGPVFGSCVPIVEEPASPEQQHIELVESDIEDTFNEDPDEIPMIKLNMEEFTENLQNYVQSNMELQEVDMSKALVALNPGAASIPTPKLKNISRLRTEHQVYELPDSHPLLKKMDTREADDPSPYLLAIWTPGETATSIQPPEQQCQSQGITKLCNEETCFSCNSIREANSQTVRGTILIPCRTAMRGSFPLNGTYFQVNEVFADHESSINPIDVPRAWIWNLPRRTVYFGTSVSSIFKGLTTEGIQYCFWRGFVCVRGFEQKTRAPRPLIARLHFPASRLAKTKNEKK